MSYWFHVEQPDKADYEEFEQNVTYNNSSILKLAGFHPDVLNGVEVARLRPVVTYVEQVLRDNPEYFEQFDPENGWGGYESTFEFIVKLAKYLLDAPDDFVLRVS